MSIRIAATAMLAVIMGAFASGPARAETTINALFMSQAAYSEDNVRDMTADFMKANPGIKVNFEFVPYEGLRDKTLLAQGAGSGYDVVLFDELVLAPRVSVGFCDELKLVALPFLNHW